MTYQEIKDRLSKCELALSKIKDGTYSSTTPTDLNKIEEKLNLLKRWSKSKTNKRTRRSFIFSRRNQGYS